jgi:long-subunit fatty acid transport protein
VSLFDERLLVALEFSHALLADAHEVLPLSIAFTERPDTHLEQEIVLGWRDSQAASLGLEYDIDERWAARVGYQLTRSGTPNETASPVAPPPGTIHGVHGGAGLKLGALSIDAGGAYAFGGADVTESENGPPGRYDGDYILIAGSVGYRH